MAERAVYLGPRIRRLRRSLGLTQADMGAHLGVSGSYVALLEGNQRPLTADMLLRIGRTYKVDVAELAGASGPHLGDRLRQVLKDPMFADLDIPALHDVDVATNYPMITEAFLRLHTAYREEQLALADHAAGRSRLPEGRSADPVDEVRRFLAIHKNYFEALDELGETLSKNVDDAGGLSRFIEEKHGLRTRAMPSATMGGAIRRYDPHHRTIFLDDRLDRASRRFHLAQQLLYLEARDLLANLSGQGSFSSEDSGRLTRRALAAYGAAALLMPYREFHAATTELAYDVEALARHFGSSFEQVAHRLTTLQRPGESGVPFFFIRVDSAGNVSKQLDGAGFPFARHRGGCPLWNVHDVFRRQREVITQWLELPNGEQFFSIARSVSSGGGSYSAPQVRRAVALCCAAGDAKHLIYARGVPKSQARDATPIGISCDLCHRQLCGARAVPPLGQSLLPDDYHRREAPYGFADQTA